MTYYSLTTSYKIWQIYGANQSTSNWWYQFTMNCSNIINSLSTLLCISFDVNSNIHEMSQNKDEHF